MEQIELPNGMKIKLHPLPPDDFVAENADNRTLQIYGLPKKPENEQLLKIWNRVAHKKLKFIKPKFKPLKK